MTSGGCGSEQSHSLHAEPAVIVACVCVRGGASVKYARALSCIAWVWP